ncbi:MAG: twin-arginine translocase TatA/TatE family subunit [Chitinivibrionales bacterium]|nr:twin-arginine translocase TatA/TatE family subunit [Chitinivibrionales bacterium]
MGEFSIVHWLVVILVLMLLFGGKKIPELAKGLGKGIREFSKARSGEDEEDEKKKLDAGKKVSSPPPSGNQETKSDPEQK